METSELLIEKLHIIIYWSVHAPTMYLALHIEPSFAVSRYPSPGPKPVS